MINEAEFFAPTDWEDLEERAFALDSLEATYAEMRYVDEDPPSASRFVRSHAAGTPELNEPAMPDDVRRELLQRCMVANLLIAADDESYMHWRNIRTPADQVAARGRRARSKAAARRWRDSDFSDGDTLAEMLEAFNEIDAEQDRRGRNA